MTGDLPM